MKEFSLLVFSLFLSIQLVGQVETEPNLKNGYAVKGYDVVAYFDEEVKKGKEDYVTMINGVTYKFSSQSNLDKFDADPEKYMPQYGGWCAYAIATNATKVDINPKTYEIRDGKLYLFYNKLFTNTLKLWQKEGADKLKLAADENWQKGIE